MKQIKSLHIDTEKTWRGGEQQLLYLVQVLRDLESSPVVICQTDSELGKALGAEGIKYYKIKMRGEFDVLSAIKIAKIVDKDEIDIVHSHTSHAHSLAVIASFYFKRKAKLVVSRRVDFRLKRNFFNRMKYRIPDKYIAISHAVRDVLISCGVTAEKIDIAYSGIDINKFTGASKNSLMKEFGLSGDETIIGNVAHFADHKGQKYLIDAFAKLLTGQKGVKLFIVGHGELEGALKKQAAKLGINDSVVFTGFRKDVGNFYALFDLFVMSSHLEGLCTSILDALIMRTPVVAANAGGIPEMIKDRITGRLVRTKDPSALKDAMIDVIQNPKDAKAYAENGYQFVCEKFDYHITAEKTYDIYKELLS